MQPNGPAPGSRGRGVCLCVGGTLRGRLRIRPLRTPALPAVVVGQVRWVSRRGARVGQVAQLCPSGHGGELTAGRAERQGPTEESGGIFHPSSAGPSGPGRSCPFHCRAASLRAVSGVGA